MFGSIVLFLLAILFFVASITKRDYMYQETGSDANFYVGLMIGVICLIGVFL